MDPTSDHTPEPETFSARCAEDLIAVAPIVLGFQPQDSVVMLTGDGARPFHARVDLPARDGPVAEVAAAVDVLAAAARSNGVRSIALVFFSDDERAVRRAWRPLRRRCEAAGIRVLDAVRADGRRYFPLLGDRRARETGVAYDVSAHPFTARAVLRGTVVQEDRAALARTAAPDRAAQAAVALLLAATAPPASDQERRRDGEWVRATLTDRLRDGSRLADADVARVVHALRDRCVRDAAWTLMTRADAGRHRDLWLDVVRRTPDHLVAAPAALLGWAAWLSGDGALAWIGVDRCREVCSDYALADLLAGALTRAVPPEQGEPALAWDEGLAG